MSYILDALQKSDGSTPTDTLNTPPPATPAGLALPWKIAIGAVLLVNLVLLYLWRTDRGDLPTVAAGSNTAAQGPVTASPNATGSPSNGFGSPLQSTPQSAKKTLPGIASPRELPAPRAQTAPRSQRGTATQPTTTTGPRTFRPTGAAITIAESDTSQPTLAEPSQTRPTQTQPEQSPPRRAQAEAPRAVARQRNGQPSRLSQLSDGAREALYVLTFSTHIYGDDADLRAVVVNGQRLTEGNSVSADNGQEFLLEEITDDGVILRFEHEGVSESVEIPVMEDWKDA